MSTINLIAKTDGFIQYIDKVLDRLENSKNLKITSTIPKGKGGQQLHRTRRDFNSEKSDACKALQISSAENAGAANIATATSSVFSSIPFFGAFATSVSSGVAAGLYTAAMSSDIQYINDDCDSIPFDEIKHIMDERFNNLDRAVDRNYAALRKISKLVKKTLTVVEQTRIEMHQGFNQVLETIKDSRIKPILSTLNSFIQYFDTEKYQIQNYSRDNYISQIEEINNYLNFLKDSTTPKGDSLQTQVNLIIDQNFAIPSDADDITGISALYALHFGTQTYVSVLFFLIEQHSYIGDYYFENGDLQKFNDHFATIQDVFQNFRRTLVLSNGLIDKVISIITNVQDIDFIADDRVLSETLSEKLEELKQSKDQILKMTLPVVEDIPPKFPGTIMFNPPLINEPLGDWVKGLRVSYAMQYRDGDKYSRVGEWSDAFTVDKHANPFLRIPTDPKRRTRLIYRKFDELKSQLIGIIEDETQTEYRDIHRDLYNQASSPNTAEAEKVVDILLQNGANSTAIFDQGRSALHSAAYGGSAAIAIDKLKPTNINIRDDNGYTPLHIAAGAGHNELIKVLVQNGADINAQTFAEELTPIHLAARKGYESTVRTLMESQGIDINLDDNEGFTPLHSAVTGGLLVVEAILSHKRVNVNQKSNTGVSALHLAAMNNYKDIAEALLRTGKLNINIEAEGKMTPHHFATISGHLEMVQFLLNNGANINVKSVTNWTPLHFAISLKKVDIASEFLQSKSIDLNPTTEDNITPMHIACGSGQVEIVQKILEHKAPDIVKGILSAETNHELTPLHIGIMKKYSNIVSILLEKGAGIELTTDQDPLKGQSYIIAAAASGSLDIVKMLFKKIPLNSSLAAYERNAITSAAENGHLDIVKYIVEEKQLLLSPQDPAIMSAIPKGQLKIIQYLVDDRRISLACGGYLHKTCPLSEACKYGHLDIVRYIASKNEKGIDFSGVPLANAAQYGHLHIVKYLIESKKVDPNERVDGYTPMHLAITYGWFSIVKYLHEKHKISLNIDWNVNQLSSIQLAVSSGNLNLVKYLMDRVGYSSLETRSLLQFAVYGPNHEKLIDKKSSSVLRYLVDEKKYDVNAKGVSGDSPLFLAAYYDSFYALKFLISRKADFYITDDKGQTLLVLPLETDIMAFVETQNVCNQILKNEIPVISQYDSVNNLCIDTTKGLTDDIYHTTPLHLAASTGAIETVKLLINNGWYIDGRDGKGNVPLHFAVQNENIDMINLLVLKGADTTLKNVNNQTPKDLAKEKGVTNIVEILKQAQTDRNRGSSTRVKKSINQEASLGTESSSKDPENVLTYIIEKVCGDSGATSLCLQSSSGNQDFIDVGGAQCFDSNVSLGLLLAQKFLNKKFPLPKFSHITTAEARAMAATISNKFEKLLKKHTKKADDLDFYQLYKDIEANIENEKFTNVPNVLLEYAQKACGKDVGPVADKIAKMFPKL